MTRRTGRWPIGLTVIALVCAAVVIVAVAAGIGRSPASQPLVIDSGADSAKTSRETWDVSGITAPDARVTWEVDGVRGRDEVYADPAGRFELSIPLGLGTHHVRLVSDTPPTFDREDEVVEVYVSRASDPPAPPRLLAIERDSDSVVLTFWSEPGTEVTTSEEFASNTPVNAVGLADIFIFGSDHAPVVEAFAVNDQNHRSPARIVDLSEVPMRFDRLVDGETPPKIETTLAIGRTSVTRSIRATFPSDTAGLSGIIASLRRGGFAGDLAPIAISGGARMVNCYGDGGWLQTRSPRVTRGSDLQIALEGRYELRWAGPVSTDNTTVKLCARTAIPHPGTIGSLSILSAPGLIENTVPEPFRIDEAEGQERRVFENLPARQTVVITLTPQRSQFAESIYTDFVETGNLLGLDTVVRSSTFALPRLIPIILLIGIAGVGRTTGRLRPAFGLVAGVIVLVPLLALVRLGARALEVTRQDLTVGASEMDTIDIPRYVEWLLSTSNQPYPELRASLALGGAITLAVLVVPWFLLHGVYPGVGRRLLAICVAAAVLALLLFAIDSAAYLLVPAGQPSSVALDVLGLGLGIGLMAIVTIWLLRTVASILKCRIPAIAGLALVALGLASIAVWLAPPELAGPRSTFSFPGSLLLDVEITARRTVYLVWLILPLLLIGLALALTEGRPWERAARAGAREWDVLWTAGLLFAVFVIGFDGFVLGIPVAPVFALVVFFFLLLESVQQSKRLAVSAPEIRTRRGDLVAAALQTEPDPQTSTQTTPRESASQAEKPNPRTVVGVRSWFTAIGSRLLKPFQRSTARKKAAVPAQPVNSVLAESPLTDAAKQGVLALGPYRNRSQNVRLGVQVAALLSLLVLPFYLVQLDTTSAWQSLAQGLVAFEVRWLVIGALFGLLFEYIRAPTGLAKGLWLGIAIVLVRIPFALVELSLGWTTVGVVSFSVLQAIAFTTAVGFVFDMVTIRRSRAGHQRRWAVAARDALSLSGGPYVVGFATTLITGAGVAIAAVLGDSLNQLLTDILRGLAPTPFPTS